MKLRIRGNSIRLRLTKTEVATLSEKSLVEEKTDFGNGNCFVYAIVASTETNIISATFTNNRLEVNIPQTVAKDWASNEEIGISVVQQSLKVLIEKDFSCLIPRITEDDADTFPHPKSNK